MAIRAKFQLQSITGHYWSNSTKTLKFYASYDSSIPEDQRFAQATPSGTFEMTVDNPAALAQFELGKQYYFDITPADAPEQTSTGVTAGAPSLTVHRQD